MLKLGEILKRFGGRLQTGPFGSQLHAHEYQSEGVPVVMPQDINDGCIGVRQIARIHERRAEELGRHRMRVGDIVIARRGDLSRAAAIGEAEVGWLCGTGCFLLRLAGSSLSPDFASLVYRQSFVQRQVDARAVGATMPSLNNAVMSSLLYPFCATEEQELIVKRIASSENVLVENLKNQHALKQQKQGLMQDLLTEKVSVQL
ncbi:hypothetical protein SH580_13235 [Coraliomargarita algicola]|uniref:Type I restriction modification DNA specificity domain-containing protein n=1 Tax=Coraliomargarita algicola TaxID=3092156 RepID=A0ABZ0REH2_9BACT|nr:hypothetical protein [Coraliomargarita sp. J2-16]WPJ94397.1 hypothetical protein SH580_13235 [Coraliomargarita sp. J2-16]